MIDHVKIRAATASDTTDVVALLNLAGYPVPAGDISAWLSLLLTEPRHVVAVAERGGATLGLLAVSARPSLPLGGWVAAIEVLVVHSEARRAGVGEALLQYAKGLAVERGVVRLEVLTAGPHDPAAGEFLFALGFEVGDARPHRWRVLEGKHPRLPVAERLATVPS